MACWTVGPSFVQRVCTAQLPVLYTTTHDQTHEHMWSSIAMIQVQQKPFAHANTDTYALAATSYAHLAPTFCMPFAVATSLHYIWFCNC